MRNRGKKTVDQKPPMTWSMTSLFSKVPAEERREVKSIWWLGCHLCQEAWEIGPLFPNLETLLLVDPLVMKWKHPKIRRFIPKATITKLAAAVTSKEEYLESNGRKQFRVTSNAGASSSLRPMLETHSKHFPHVVSHGSIETDLAWLGMLGTAPDVLLMDIQGSEYDVLNGAPEVVLQIRFVYAEVSYVPLYDGQGLYEDLCRLMDTDFELVGTYTEHVTFGNSLWRRR